MLTLLLTMLPLLLTLLLTMLLPLLPLLLTLLLTMLPLLPLHLDYLTNFQQLLKLVAASYHQDKNFQN